MSAAMRDFLIVIEPSAEGGFVATVPELPGCFTQGDTLEQVRERAREAILLTLEDMREQGDGRPAPIVEHLRLPAPR